MILEENVGTPGPWAAVDGRNEDKVTRATLQVVLDRISRSPATAAEVAHAIGHLYPHRRNLNGSCRLVDRSLSLLRSWDLIRFDRKARSWCLQSAGRPGRRSL